MVKAVAAAETGGVMFHCGREQDRTGLIPSILLALATEIGTIRRRLRQ